MSFMAKNPLSIPEIENSPPPPAEGTRGLFSTKDGWYDIDDNGTVKKILTEGDSTEGEAPIKSITANGITLEPDENKNVDIPLAIPPQEIEAASVEVDTSAASGARAPIFIPPSNYNPMGNDGLMSADDKWKLDSTEFGAQKNVQSDWNQTDDTKDDYIKNKPNVDNKVDKEDGKGLSSNDFTNDYKLKLYGIEPEAQVNLIESISANGTPIAIQEKTAMLPITVNPKGYCNWLTHDEDETGIIPLQQSVAIINNEITYFSDYEVNSYGYIGITLNLDTFINDKNVNGHTEDEELHMANAEFIFKTPTNAITFSYPSELKFIGLDVEDGVFVPQPNMKYDVIFSWCKESNFAPIAYVSGYEVSE